jgi:hypothetical protein
MAARIQPLVRCGLIARQLNLCGEDADGLSKDGPRKTGCKTTPDHNIRKPTHGDGSRARDETIHGDSEKDVIPGHSL